MGSKAVHSHGVSVVPSVHPANHNVQSKSVNKTQKMSKLKEKYISIEKSKHRDNITHTHAGFYKNKPPKI